MMRTAGFWRAKLSRGAELTERRCRVDTVAKFRVGDVVWWRRQYTNRRPKGGSDSSERAGSFSRGGLRRCG